MIDQPADLVGQLVIAREPSEHQRHREQVRDDEKADDPSLLARLEAQSIQDGVEEIRGPRRYGEPNDRHAHSEELPTPQLALAIPKYGEDCQQDGRQRTKNPQSHSATIAKRVLGARIVPRMDGYDASTYGERIAEVYDQLHPAEVLDTDATVEFLSKRAGSGPVLELAIGTGRVALPLVQRGIEVHGIDASEAMVSKLRAKPGGDDLSVSFGDFKDVDVEGRFSLIYLTFNTIYALTTQEDQLTCFRNVAEHLTEDGVFVLDAFFPDTSRFVRNQTTQVNEIEVDRVFIDVSRHDPVAQTISSQHLIFTPGGVEMYPVHLRYIWPAEFDLMARLAGLVLTERYAGYGEQPFGSASRSHVSVYGPSSKS